MSALTEQVGGSHYKDCKIQPIQYIEANKLSFLEACVVKRVTRHDKPTGKGRQDIEKAIHELQLLLELRYGESTGLVGEAGNKGYTKCPHCKELTRAVQGCLSNACDQCQRVFGFGGTIEVFCEERMDVIGQNGNDGEHYEVKGAQGPVGPTWRNRDTAGQPHPAGTTPVYVRWRSGAESDIPLMAGEVDWSQVIAYRLA